jgi:hypothetical protein
MLFIPAAGFFNGTSVDESGGYDFVWSSSLSSDGPYDARYLYFGNGNVGTYNYNRSYGFSVRAVRV